MKHHISPDQELRERKIVQKILEGKRSKEAVGKRRQRWPVILTIAFLASILCSILLWGAVAKQPGSSTTRNGSSGYTAGRRSAQFSSPSGPDIMMLKSALNGFQETQSLPTIQSLVRHMVTVGQSLVDQLPIGVDEDGALAHSLEKGVGDMEVDILLKSSTTLYHTLSRIMGEGRYADGEDDLTRSNVFSAAVKDIPATVYQWVVSTCFILNYVLPEYYVRHEPVSRIDEERETAAHMSVLLQSTNLAGGLSASVLDNIPAQATGGSLCRTLSGAPKAMIKFCDSSFHSKAAVSQRIAANYEELIALSPRYGPFRLHYAAALVDLWLLPIPQVKKGLIQNVIRHDRERAESYGFKDAHHIAILNWIEHIVLSNQKRTDISSIAEDETRDGSSAVTAESVSEAGRVLDILEAVSSCRVLMHPSGGSTWPVISLHPEVSRPFLFTAEKIKYAMSNISSLIPGDIIDHFTSC